MRPNAWVGLASILMGLAYGIQAFNLPRAPIGNPMGPIYFPLGLAGLMIFLGALLFVTEARKGLNSDDKSKRPKFHFESMKLILAVIVCCLLYTVLFERLGFVLSTIIFLMSMLMVVNGSKQWLLNAVVTVGFSLGAWYLFVRVFQISLPTSPFGIF